MNFLCTCCKQRITKGERVSRLVESAGVHNYAYHMEWAVFDEEEISRPITERKWSDRNIQPIVGDKRILRVKRPFDEDLGGVFTNIYEPWQMFYNGWDSAESPEDIQKTCAVLCRFDEVLWADEFSAYIVVTVLHTLPLCRLHQVFPETVTDRNFSRSLVSVMMSGRSMRTSICSIVHGLLRAISAMCSCSIQTTAESVMKY